MIPEAWPAKRTQTKPRRYTDLGALWLEPERDRLRIGPRQCVQSTAG